MEKKRKYTKSNVSRTESTRKKRTSTPPDRAASQVPPPIVEPLPNRIVPGQALPTLEQPQGENLPANEFQSISESGVLAESLQRSRQKWLSEGIFEKYWTKPVKKKGAPAEPANNPPKDSMTKLGSCTITVEPHVFEATMYAIKEPARPVIHPPVQQPLPRPVIQYGPPNGVMPPPQPVAPPSMPIKQVVPSTVNAESANHPNAAPSTFNGASTQTIPPAAPPASNKSADPVIQMLAERAATDTDLKALMRIVANGEATPEELKKFQSHIDELTELAKTRPLVPTPAPAQQPAQALPPASQAVNGKAKEALPVIPKPSARPPPQQPQPQALRSKGPIPTKSDISGIVLEFTGGTGDRYLFPKFSILEYLPGGQVIASFLIVRKGSSSDSPTYDRELDYYQPITIRLYTHQGRQLESLQKVVAHPDEVRRYMDDIMDNMTRAEYVLLAMRLPRDSEKSAAKDDAESLRNDPSEVQPPPLLWPTVNATPPGPPLVQKHPPTQRLLSEEEKYQSFIASVSSTV